MSVETCAEKIVAGELELEQVSFGFEGTPDGTGPVLVPRTVEGFLQAANKLAVAVLARKAAKS